MAAVIIGCHKRGPFALTSEKANPAALKGVFAAMKQPRTAPLNKLGVPMVFAVGKTTLSAIDLVAKRTLWSVQATIRSRVVVSKEAVVAREGDSLVGRAIESGNVLWRRSLVGELIGASADSRAYCFVEKRGKQWAIECLTAATGKTDWSHVAAGALGAPTVIRGIVLVPFLRQWLSVFSAPSGSSLARVRAVDEQISFTRATATDVFFGSKRGVFLFDENAAAASRAQSTYGSATLPTLFFDAAYGVDAYDAGQADYTALEQRMIRWAASASAGKLQFQHGLVTVHYFRHLFGIEANTGALRWALRGNADWVGVDLDSQPAAAIDRHGTVVFFDSETGHQSETIAKLTGEPIRGGTFDRAPISQASASVANSNARANEVVDVLVSIATDRDRRFDSLKAYVVSEIGKLGSIAAAEALVTIVLSGEATETTVAAAEKAILAIRNPAIASVLVAGIRGGCLSLCAGALGQIEAKTIEPAMRVGASEALVRFLVNPKTTVEELYDVVLTLGHLGEGELELAQFARIHRTDSGIASSESLARALCDVLIDLGEHGVATVEMLASDPITHPRLAEQAASVLQAKNAATKTTPAVPDSSKDSSKP